MGRHMLVRAVATVLGAALLAGCGTQAVGTGGAGSTSPPVAVQADPSVPARLADTGASEDDISAVAAADNDFSWALFQAVREKSQNLVCSPYSVLTGLSMTMAGAQGKTQEQMKQVLGVALAYDRLHPAVSALDRSLTGGGSFSSANGLWAQTGRQIKQPFVDTAGRYYGAALHVYDMDRDYAGLCRTINAWVSDKTAGRIQGLMDPADKPDVALLLMLVNAVHFKDDWEQPFSVWSTRPEPFVRVDGTSTDVQMMWNMASYSYLKAAEVRAVMMPYVDARFSMVVLMPSTGTFEDFVTGLDGQAMAGIIDQMKRGRVSLRLPQFEIDSKPAVKQALQSLGMTTAFTPDADFSAIADPPPGNTWMITDVVQKAFITVNEKGTEAAAATGTTVAAAGTTTEAPFVEMTFDHPFVYLIRDSITGAILFIGQVVSPVAPGK